MPAKRRESKLAVAVTLFRVLDGSWSALAMAASIHACNQRLERTPAMAASLHPCKPKKNCIGHFVRCWRERLSVEPNRTDARE
eukprot:1161298-Pelagomonas_calceolata.AAC.12